MIKNVFFDLDGTLLPMDQEQFVKAYFKNLAAKLSPYGYDPQGLIDGIWAGTVAMVANDGSKLNEQVFWEKFAAIFGERVYEDKDKFEEFYRNEFDNAASVCGFNKSAKAVVDFLKSQSLRIVLATNPIFPSIATYKRIGWAGLKPDDFEFITTYENIGFCKPNLGYYRNILHRLNMNADETIMVGNDVGEDMIAEKIGLKVFLVTDCLIDRGADITVYDRGSLDELMEFFKVNR